MTAVNSRQHTTQEAPRVYASSSASADAGFVAIRSLQTLQWLMYAKRQTAHSTQEGILFEQFVEVCARLAMKRLFSQRKETLQ